MDAVKEVVSNEAGELFKGLEQSYYNRCKHQDSAKAAVDQLIELYPPDRLTDYKQRPSLALASESGDLGPALSWNAQATLFRPLLKTLLETETDAATLNLLGSVYKNDMGALAVSESKIRPLIVTPGEDGPLLDGDKRYITGGRSADFILMTGRSPADDIFSSMVFLPVRDIPEDAMHQIDLGCFKTTKSEFGQQLYIFDLF